MADPTTHEIIVIRWPSKERGSYWVAERDLQRNTFFPIQNMGQDRGAAITRGLDIAKERGMAFNINVPGYEVE